MLKKILIGVGIIVIVAVGAIWFTFSQLDSIVQKVVEKVGTEVTKAPVSLSGVEIKLAEGTATLRGFTLGNPAGFKSDHAISLGEITVAIDTSSLSKEHIGIKQIKIGAPDVIYEMAQGGSNIDAIQKNVQSYSGGSSGSESGGEASNMKVTIDDLYVNDGKITVDAPFLPEGGMTTPLPDIHLKDIGKDSGGASPQEVAQKLLGAINGAIINSVGKLDLKGMMEGAAGAVQDGAKGATDLIKKGTEGAGGLLKSITGD